MQQSNGANTGANGVKCPKNDGQGRLQQAELKWIGCFATCYIVECRAWYLCRCSERLIGGGGGYLTYLSDEGIGTILDRKIGRSLSRFLLELTPLLSHFVLGPAVAVCIALPPTSSLWISTVTPRASAAPTPPLNLMATPMPMMNIFTKILIQMPRRKSRPNREAGPTSPPPTMPQKQCLSNLPKRQSNKPTKRRLNSNTSSFVLTRTSEARSKSPSQCSFSTPRRAALKVVM